MPVSIKGPLQAQRGVVKKAQKLATQKSDLKNENPSEVSPVESPRVTKKEYVHKSDLAIIWKAIKDFFISPS